MSTGIGEAELDAGILRELPEHLGTMIGNSGAPADGGAVFEHQIKERVDRVQAPAVHTDLAERLADDRGIRAGNDLGIEKVSVPDSYTKRALVLLAEPATVLLVAQQIIALHFVAQVQGCGPRTEFLEDHQVDTVRIDLKWHG